MNKEDFFGIAKYMAAIVAGVALVLVVIAGVTFLFDHATTNPPSPPEAPENYAPATKHRLGNNWFVVTATIDVDEHKYIIFRGYESLHALHSEACPCKAKRQ